MAAPLKQAQLVLGLHALVRPCSCSLRYMSNSKSGRKNGPAPWAAQEIPTGKTFYAIQLAKMQHKEIWKKRMEYVNRPWKKVLKDYHKVKEKTTNVEDPPKLLMVKRVRTTGGRPYWEKTLIKQLGLEEFEKPVILKNKQHTNGMLRQVKHLVEIFPVTFPYGLPESEDDYQHSYITDNGQFIVKRKLEPVIEVEDKTTAEIPDEKFEMKQQFIDRHLELKKVKYQIAQEYYQTKYIFERNEDGKEFRYKGEKDIGYDKIWH